MSQAQESCLQLKSQTLPTSAVGSRSTCQAPRVLSISCISTGLRKPGKPSFPFSTRNGTLGLEHAKHRLYQVSYHSQGPGSRYNKNQSQNY